MTVMETAVGEIMKGLRGDNTQLQWGIDMGVVRETVSKYETGRSKVPADISRKMMNKYDDPKFAITIQQEYTGTGPRWLDGPNVDLHRCSVRDKTIEELEEALVAIKNTSMSKPAFALTPQEREEHKKTLEEIVELVTAATKYIAVGTDYLGISYSGVWNEHYNYLQQEGFIK